MSTWDERAEPLWTLLVCMPECQAAHARIVRELRDDGVNIVEHRFTLTLDQALIIVQQYAHLRRRATEPFSSTSAPTEAEVVETSLQSPLPSGWSELRHRRWIETSSQQSSR
ncbi:hypothetical protein Q4I32_001689 [Leishmania shawi]|uniref:Uncharacterized protein n=1 Tax=Leishmania shawi TaxID=5680 RepID=A0AAW3C5H1_9TRYP